MKKGLSRIKMGIRALVGVVGGYLGVISTILGTIFGILASILVVGLIAGICVYVKVIPMFTEAREVVFDNLVNMTEEDFVMNEDTLVFDDKGRRSVRSMQDGLLIRRSPRSRRIFIMDILRWRTSVSRRMEVWIF